MRVHVSMLIRNEMGRYLDRVLECAHYIASGSGGRVVVTDDSSDDGTEEFLRSRDVELQTSPFSLFWQDEGMARQRHYEFTQRYCEEGDWILALDADETINFPSMVPSEVERAVNAGYSAIGLPLYEFWEPRKYRTDGFWFGTRTPRLYRWQPDGHIREREMGCGSEPTYVQTARAKRQDRLHLLHWGYLRPGDRVRKHAAYMERLGGHGHNDRHIQSIIAEPTLEHYPPEGAPFLVDDTLENA